MGKQAMRLYDFYSHASRPGGFLIPRKLQQGELTVRLQTGDSSGPNTQAGRNVLLTLNGQVIHAGAATFPKGKVAAQCKSCSTVPCRQHTCFMSMCRPDVAAALVCLSSWLFTASGLRHVGSAVPPAALPVVLQPTCHGRGPCHVD